MKKTTEVAAPLNDEALALLRSMYPQEEGYTRLMLPRLSFKSQDVMEGTGKNKKVVIAAGTFFTEHQTEETDENNKKVWEKTEIGDTLEGIIIYKRKQLRMYDEATEEYSSTPIFDTNEDIVPLFCAKKEVARGTAAQLKALYEYEETDDQGKKKKKSKLQDNTILYVLVDGQLYQLNIHGSSMWSFNDYSKSVLVASVVTTFSSEYNKNGSIEWNKMMFKAKRQITPEELETVVSNIKAIKDAVNSEKLYFAGLMTAADVPQGEALAIAAPEDKDDF